MTATTHHLEAETVGIKEAAKIAKVHPDTIRKWIRDKRLASTQPGGKRTGSPHRIKLIDLNAVLSGLVDEDGDDDIGSYEAKPEAT